MLSFSLLGQTVVLKNGEPVSKFRSQKEAALLIYLAHTGQTHQREFIAELLWESSSTKQALTNLRTALSRLRKQVDAALVITRKTLALAPESQQQVDSVKLLQMVASIEQIDTVEKATTLQKALDTYQGAFLADFHLTGSQNFAEWVTTTREQIRRQVMTAYDKLGRYALAADDAGYGIALARRWLQVDALNESTHTLLIRLQIEQGNVREAMAQYAHAANLLKTELDIEPSAEMTALIKKARPRPATTKREPTLIRHNLPPAYDQFFGRQTAQQEIHTRLDQPWCRLVTIMGQGGVGKTRLATTIARSRRSQYPDGVWLVELENIDADDNDLAETIAVEIATILDLRLTGSATPVEQLLNHLQHKQMLLVLDNFEHLLAGAQIVLDIVQRCEKVQMIVTSREALRIRAEWTIALTGLSYPTSDADALSSEAVELFVARRAQQQRGAVAADELTAVRNICRLVEGLPLAIELAAALTRHATPQTIANRLQDGFDALKTSLRDVPQRHQELHVVFEMSWRTLTPELQTQLARLSIFRGGFTETAVAHITQASTHHLTALIEKSLLTYHAESERYTLHPVIRAYAAEKRGFADPTPHKHAHYYLTLLAQQTKPLQKNEPQTSIRLLEPDIENARQAWQTALSAHNAELLHNALTSLSIYYQLRGLAHEGETVMQETMSAAKTWEAEAVGLAARAGLERARFQNRLGQYRPAMQTIKATLKSANQCNDRWAEGMGHMWWGESLWRLGEYNAAKEKLTHALDIGHALDATLIIGWGHHQLGIVHDIQSRFDTAHDHLEKACTAWRGIDNLQALSGSLNSIGLVCYHQGDLTAAQQAMEKALAICDQLDDRHRQSLLVNNLSMILLEQGDYEGAQYYLQLGHELATISGNLTVQGEIYINLGRNYLLRGEPDLAGESLERGLQIAKSVGNRTLMATAMFVLAEVKSGQGNLERAESLYDQTLKIARQDNLQGVECETLISMAELFGMIDAERAKQYIVQAVKLAEGIQNLQLLEQAKTIAYNLSASANLNDKNLPT
ncbi:tetratricopeptide repeat protein [Candidatus Leptofilum sp.]|uniref:tetratricopeptide repeat protein n=1 Tax=Candidatus Leptofilum sp. TaxID=3241576 RepID=UPI003B5C1B59